MNRRPPGDVEEVKVPGRWLVLTVLLAAGGGCVDVNGGAVELSWVIKKATAVETSCAAERIESVHLVAERLDCAADAGPCTIRPGEWQCARQRGNTGFEIDPGRWALSVGIGCEEGMTFEQSAIDVPPPIVRDITEGDVAQLGALLIQVDGTPCSE